MTVTYQHVTIKGAPYTVTPCNHPDGPAYRVTAASSPTDRFHRSYTVRLHPAGVPQSCTCADHVHRGGTCKHMAAVAQLVAPTTTPLTVLHLVNEALRKEFRVHEYVVEVVTYWRSERRGAELLDREAARKLYSQLLATGWDRF